MPALLETTDEHSLLRCEGAVDICGAAEVKQLLVTAIERGCPIAVSLASATEMDVTAAQLFCAAARAARGMGIGFVLADPPPDEAWAVLREGGLEWARVFDAA